MQHKGHDLKDGSKGDPHFQTEGVNGHTFWGSQSGAIPIGMLAEVLIIPFLATPSTLASGTLTGSPYDPNKGADEKKDGKEVDPKPKKDEEGK